MSTGGASLKSINTAPNSRATLRIQPVSNRSPRYTLASSYYMLHRPHQLQISPEDLIVTRLATPLPHKPSHTGAQIYPQQQHTRMTP